MNQKTIYWLAVLAICGSASGSEEKTRTEKSAEVLPVAVVEESVEKQISLALNLTNVGEAIRGFNPDLKAARLRIEEARARLRQSGLLPNPQVSTGFGHDPAFREVEGGVGFSQTFPVTARLRLEKEVSAAEVAVAEAEVGNVERRLIGDARLAAVQYLALQRQKQLRTQQLGLARELATYIDGIAKRGEGSPLDAAQARLEAKQLEVEIRQFDTASQQLIGRLKPLIGLAPEDALSLSGTFGGAVLPPMAKLDLKDRSDYEAAQMAVIVAGREVKLEKARKWEDITAGLFAGFSREEDAPEGLVAEQQIGVQISIPLPFWNKNEGAIEERRVREKRLELSVVALANRIRNEVQTAYLTMDTQASLAREIADGLLPGAEQQVADTATAYRDGLVDLQPVLRARDQQLKIKAAHLDAVRDYHLARVRYETALGKTN